MKTERHTARHRITTAGTVLGIALIATIAISANTVAAADREPRLPAIAPEMLAADAVGPITRNGREVCGLLAKRDAAAVFGRFDATMAKAVPLTSLSRLLDTTFTASAPLGKRLAEDTKLAGGETVYAARFQWQADAEMAIRITFDDSEAKSISGLWLAPASVTNPKPDAATEGVLAAGRSAAALVRKGDSAALVGLFTPGMAKAVPKPLIDATLTQFFGDGSTLGELIEDKVEDGPDEGLVTYTGRYKWKPDQPMTLIAGFVKDSGGKIAMMRLVPDLAPVLPPDPHAGYRMKTPIHLPFLPGQEWTVVWGGDTRGQNYHVDAPDQRHAFDILIARDGKTHDGDGSKLEQYYAFGQPLLAPASGTVIEAVNNLPDNPIGKMDPAHAFGNHILLDIGHGEYVMMAHMKQGSVAVRKGDHVALGQRIGLCGNTGNTSEPHLHIHVQDKPYTFRDALGLPVTFVDYTRNGKPVASGSPLRGEQISAH